MFCRIALLAAQTPAQPVSPAPLVPADTLGQAAGKNLADGHLAVAKGDDAAALGFYQAAVGLSPLDAKVHYHLGYVQAKLKNFRAAIASLETALNLAPADGDIRATLGATWLQTGAPHALAKAYEELHRSLALKRSVTTYNNLGNVFLAQRSLDSAGFYFEQAVRLDSFNAEARINLANVFVQQFKPDLAIAALNAARRLAPANADFYYTLGNAEFLKSNPRAAATHFQKVLTLDTALVDVRYNLGVALAASGDFAGAENEYSVLKTQNALLAETLLADINRRKPK